MEKMPYEVLRKSIQLAKGGGFRFEKEGEKFSA